MAPHYVRDYRRLVRTLMRSRDIDDAAACAVGGEFEVIGARRARSCSPRACATAII
jgi:hypothetical protein